MFSKNLATSSLILRVLKRNFSAGNLWVHKICILNYHNSWISDNRWLSFIFHHNWNWSSLNKKNTLSSTIIPPEKHIFRRQVSLLLSFLNGRDKNGANQRINQVKSLKEFLSVACLDQKISTYPTNLVAFPKDQGKPEWIWYHQKQ